MAKDDRRLIAGPVADLEPLLICRVLDRLCALPVQRVVETMRPLPIEPVPAATPPVLGVAVVRGAAVPVVDLAWVVAERAARPTRFVTVNADGRSVALAVDAVVGVRTLPPEALRDLPPLLRDALAGAIESIGTLDAQLLMLLHLGRLVPEVVWHALETARLPS